MKIKMETEDWLRKYITTVPDFPNKGIMFQWYGKLLREPNAFRQTIQTFAKRYANSPIDKIAGLDSRGFIFSAALSYELHFPLILIRKPGKIPCQVEQIDYQLEYGKNTFEIEKDAVKQNEKVLIIDDILATGGTAQGAGRLVERLGGAVFEFAFLLEIVALQGRKKIERPIFSLMSI